jgi:suppressor for copper-sensitivity B
VPALAGGALALLSAETTEVGSHGELRLRIAVAASSVQGPSAQAPSAQVPSLQEPSAAGADAQPPETAAPVAPPPPALRRPDAFVEGPPALSFGPPAVELGEGGRTALMRIAVAAPPGKPLGLAGERVTVTVVDGGRAIERTLTVAPAFASGGAPADASGAMPEWLAVLGLALLGGLILNLMPCVLPVLSIKLLAVLGHGGGTAREVRRGFLASAAGILASFLVLASAAVALQAAGRAAGWGLQFQEPAFLAAMAFVLVLFAANLWGRFEFRLPGGLATIAGAAGGHGLVGHFLTGAFATLLATPCSAPFLGTAVGFALARGPVEIYAVFAALGVGLAAPYLLIAAAPRLATSLPRPGAWMIKLRRVLSLALVATALWLLLVLAAQSGWIVAGLVFVMLAVAAAALWPLPEAGPRMRIASWASVAALGILAVGGVLALPSLRPAVAPYAPGLFTESDGERDTFLAARRARDADPIWRPFDRDAIEREVAGGRMVFVDVTADWCVTCRVNKAVVLDRGETRKLLAAAGVVAMRADWTRPDPSITAYLKSFGRYGIPFNAVYGPARPKGVALPELLTERAVREAFAQARGEGEAAPRVSRR